MTLESLGGVFEVLVLFQVAVLTLYVFVRAWPEWLSERLCPARMAALRSAADKKARNSAAPARAAGAGGKPIFRHHVNMAGFAETERHNPMLQAIPKARSAVRDVLGATALRH